jgi:hypothetical protein
VTPAQADALGTIAVFAFFTALLAGAFGAALKGRPLASPLLAGAVACGLDWGFVGLNLLHLLSIAVTALLLGLLGAWRALRRAERLVPRVVAHRWPGE